MGSPSLEEPAASPPTSAIPPGSLPSTFPQSCPLRVPPRHPRAPPSEQRGSEICRPCLFCEISPDPITGRFSVCSLHCVSARGIFCSSIHAEKTGPAREPGFSAWEPGRSGLQSQGDRPVPPELGRALPTKTGSQWHGVMPSRETGAGCARLESGQDRAHCGPEHCVGTRVESPQVSMGFGRNPASGQAAERTHRLKTGTALHGAYDAKHPGTLPSEGKGFTSCLTPQPRTCVPQGP